MNEMQLRILSGQANNLAFEYCLKEKTEDEHLKDFIKRMKACFPTFLDHLKECSEMAVQSEQVVNEVTHNVDQVANFQIQQAQDKINKQEEDFI